MEEFKEALKSVKEMCEKIDCSECPFSVGIYQEGLGYTYYSCDIRKKPRDWDLEKKRIKQDKNYKKNLDKKYKEDQKKKKEKKPNKEKKTKTIKKSKKKS